MAEIVKVSCFPNEGTPVVIPGDPVAGDIVRVTTSTGAVIYERFSPAQAQQDPNTINGKAEFSASIKRRAEKLSRKGDYAAASYLLSKHGI